MRSSALRTRSAPGGPEAEALHGRLSIAARDGIADGERSLLCAAAEMVDEHVRRAVPFTRPSMGRLPSLNTLRVAYKLAHLLIFFKGGCVFLLGSSAFYKVDDDGEHRVRSSGRARTASISLHGP